MKTSNYILRGFIHAVGVVAYISAVAWAIFYGEGIIDNAPRFMAPVFMLLLFVVSATITGLLVLGKPAHLYMTDFKREAMVLFSSTLGWLVIFLGIVGIVLIFA